MKEKVYSAAMMITNIPLENRRSKPNLCRIFSCITHWGRATHICVSTLAIIASDNGLSPGRRQAIIWNIAGILSIGLLWTNFSEILIEIRIFSVKKMRLKVSSAKWRPFCLGLNVIMNSGRSSPGQWPLSEDSLVYDMMVSEHALT